MILYFIGVIFIVGIIILTTRDIILFLITPETEQQRKNKLREKARLRREEKRLAKQREKEMAALARAEASVKKKEVKQKIAEAKKAFDKRCTERKSLREAVVNSVLK